MTTIPNRAWRDHRDIFLAGRRAPRALSQACVNDIEFHEAHYLRRTIHSGRRRPLSLISLIPSSRISNCFVGCPFSPTMSATPIPPFATSRSIRTI